MKKHFTKYLTEDLGFKPYRKIQGNYIENNINDYSTMQYGGIDIRYIKGNIEIVWGLHEFKKPATLISPRPKGIISDDQMNNFLKKESNENIYSAIVLKLK